MVDCTLADMTSSIINFITMTSALNIAFLSPLKALSNSQLPQLQIPVSQKQMYLRHHQHWTYVWIPLFTAFIWFGTLLAMLITWLASGRPKYVSQDGKIAYISDVGADILKPLFITSCAITGLGFFLSLCIERLLRHTGRLLPNMRRRETVFSSFAIFGSFIGGLGLLLLSIFDTKRHTTAHRAFLLVFMVGVALSAIFTLIEYRWISKDFYEVRKLKIAYKMKAIIATILILMAIAFAVALYKQRDVGAVLEWAISFGFSLYLLTFYYDLRQAKGVHKGEYSKERIRGEHYQMGRTYRPAV